MNIKSFVVAFLFFVSLTNCSFFRYSEKYSNLICLTIGLGMIADNFRLDLPKFFKKDQHKKYDHKSAVMLTKGIGAASYFIWWASIFKKTFDENYIMGSLNNDIFRTKVDDLLGNIKNNLTNYK